ncbi:hypothetical protein [Paraburkholderia unamae]|uniref:Uncharacterized protein n=1 Tax=Paraburkholderia unamae TaxID=219649 RepID=A0ACC6RFY1_9BURK
MLGLTATPVRRDSQQPVMFMLCGPIRHAAKSPASAPQVLEVFPQRLTSAVDVAADAPIQAVFARLAQDLPRTQMIAAAVREQYGQGRNVLVLTERTEHLESLQQMLQDTVQSLFVLHGRLGRKARATQLAALDALAGDPLEWVRQYFDAHVYSSNWGSCRLLLRLPHGTFDAATIRDYVKAGRKRRSRFEKAFEAMDVDDWCLLDWSFNDDSGEHARFSEEMDGGGWMTRLLPVRDELLAGDARPLYLGWLARHGNDELHEDEIEPPVPAGLQALTPAQVALAEFLMLDADWLAAAAEASPSLLAPESSGSEDSRFDPWLRELPVEEMRAKLRMLLQGRSREAERTLRNAFLKWEKGRNAKQLNFPKRRRISEIESKVASHRSN